MENDSAKLKNPSKFLWLKVGIIFGLVDFVLVMLTLSISNGIYLSSWPKYVAPAVVYLNAPAAIFFYYLFDEVFPLQLASLLYPLESYLFVLFAVVQYVLIGFIVGFIIQKLKTRKATQ